MARGAWPAGAADALELLHHLGPGDGLRRSVLPAGEGEAEGRRRVLPVILAAPRELLRLPAGHQHVEGEGPILGLGASGAAQGLGRGAVLLVLEARIAAGGHAAEKDARMAARLDRGDIAHGADADPADGLAGPVLEQEDLRPGRGDAQGEALHLAVEDQRVLLAGRAGPRGCRSRSPCWAGPTAGRARDRPRG